jgi:hypothetical protein
MLNGFAGSVSKSDKNKNFSPSIATIIRRMALLKINTWIERYWP